MRTQLTDERGDTNVATPLQPEHGKHFMTVSSGIRGWFAVEFWWNDRPDEFGPSTDNPGFYEPWDSDFMSYATKQEAIVRARELAAMQDIPFVE